MPDCCEARQRVVSYKELRRCAIATNQAGNKNGNIID